MAELTAVVPTRNRLHTLKRTLGSILDQREVDVRVVVVDEASHDDTGAFLAGLGDERVEVVRNDEPVGLPAARNLGLARATTPWVAFCDDDDLWSPTKSRAQLDAMAASSDARWAITGAILVSADLEIIGYIRQQSTDDLLRELLMMNVVPASGSGLVIETDLMRTLGGYDEDLAASEDWDMCIRLAMSSPAAVADGPNVAYRIWAGSMSSGASRMRASFGAMKARYGDLAAAHGVAFDPVRYERFVAQQEVKARRRVGGATAYVDLAWRERQPGHLVRAGLALTVPAWMDERGNRKAVSRIPGTWRSAAEAWIEAVPLAGAIDSEVDP